MGRSKKELDAGRGAEPFGTGPHGGDLPTDFPNDNGYGSHIEYPRESCAHCEAKFHFPADRDAHEASHNPDYLW